MLRRTKLLLLLCLLCAACALPAAAGDGPTGLAFAEGRFDIARDEKPLEIGLQYRFRPFELWSVPLIPMVGISATAYKNLWVYGGLRYDWKLSKHWIATPTFAVSLYEEGNGKDLGGVIEFRSGLEIAYRFDRGYRLGLEFYHLSHANIYDNNPGSNSLVLTWSLGR